MLNLDFSKDPGDDPLVFISFVGVWFVWCSSSLDAMISGGG